MKIELNKTYSFEVDNFSFGGLENEELIELFKDGRVASFFLEPQLTKWFPELTHVKGCKDHDHIDESGNKYDAKNFTKNGLKFMPSNQIGAGRGFDYETTRKKIEETGMTYIACDINNFPTVNVKFVNGIELLEKYPTATITLKDKELFFKL